MIDCGVGAKQQSLTVSGWLKLKQIVSSETKRHNELLLCRYDVWEIVYKISMIMPIIHGIHMQFLFVIGQLKKIFSKNNLAKLIEIWKKAPMEGSV